jgi:PleD family two-component response regulator
MPSPAAARTRARPAAEPPPVAAARSAGATRRKRRKVLLAEDNPVNVEVASAMLEGLGLDVSRACNGEEALHSVQADDFDVILMDCQMPVMDGFAATTKSAATSSSAAARAACPSSPSPPTRCRATANPAWPPAWTTT